MEVRFLYYPYNKEGKMKKKIALLLVMLLAMFGIASGFGATEVHADGDDITSVTSPVPDP
jgi:hypothetical protein